LVAPAAGTPLNDTFAGDVDSRMMMEPGKLIAVAIKGLQKDTFEIYPGIARMLKIMIRIAPGALLNQMGKVSEKAFARQAGG
jgi:uncharacterized oxidoreductase